MNARGDDCIVCSGAGRIGSPGAMCDFCKGTGKSPLTAKPSECPPRDEPYEPPFDDTEDNEYCECGASHEVGTEETDSGICSACGKQI